MTELIGRNLTLDTRLLDVSFTLRPRELVAIVGPNGSGKTSLMRLLAGIRRADAGYVLIHGQSIKSLSARERARILTYLPQLTEIAWPIMVRDMVALGRFAFGTSLATKSSAEIAENCLSLVGCSHLGNRSTATLSGGELALVALARVFASDSPLMLLDEPLASLDPSRQTSVMTLLRQKVAEGCGIAVVMHDLNLATQIADRIVWMKEGRIVAQTGTSKPELAQQIMSVFGVEATILADEDGRVTALAIAGPNAKQNDPLQPAADSAMGED